MIANTPKLPYYAVIFTNIQSDDTRGYSEMSDKMVELAQKQPGFLGYESARNNIGITVSYWESEEAILNWKNNVEHQEAQTEGFRRWYSQFCTRVCKVERDNRFPKL